MLIDDYQFCTEVNRANIYIYLFFPNYSLCITFIVYLFIEQVKACKKKMRIQLKRSVSLILLFQSFVCQSKSCAEPFVYPSREYINGKLYLWTRLKWKWMFSCFRTLLRALELVFIACLTWPEYNYDVWLWLNRTFSNIFISKVNELKLSFVKFLWHVWVLRGEKVM